MGYDVYACKEFRKEVTMYSVFKEEEIFDTKLYEEDRHSFVKEMHDVMGESDDFMDDYVYGLTRYEKIRHKNEEELQTYIEKAKELLPVMKRTKLLEEKNTFALWIQEKIENGYGIGKDYNSHRHYFCFKELTQAEKTDFVEVDDVDVTYSNGEIPRVFDMVKEMFNVNLWGYLIHDDDLYYNFDEVAVEKMINHDTQEAIKKVKSVYDKIENEKMKSVLDDCVRVWSEGGKLVYNR